MMLFDAATGARRPGYATLSDQQIADRQAARRGFIDRAEQAWRGPLSQRCETDARRKKRDDDEDDEPDFGASAEKIEDVRARSIAARDAWVAGLQRPSPSPNRTSGLPTGSTRHPTRDAEPDLSRHLRTEPDDDAQARRDAAAAEYAANLSNAWKTNPRAAVAIERIGEQTRGGR
jgi:hypothetical protein